MIKVYFKQAWQLLKQNRLYSTVYIIGTGLAIAMTMLLAIVYYIKVAPIYPETNRDRMMVLKGVMIQYLDQQSVSSYYSSYKFVQEHLYTLKTPEVVSAVLDTWEDYNMVELSNEKGRLPVAVKSTDDKFWSIFDYKFLSGKPFTESDFQSAIKTAVISASLANTLFGTTDAEGKYMHLDGNEFRISGVVENVSYATPETYAQVWVPFTIYPEVLIPDPWNQGFLGPFYVFMLAKSSSDIDLITAEVQKIAQTINSSQEEYELILGGPDIFWKSIFRTHIQGGIDWGEVFQLFGLLLIALLVIPAVNLAGMVSSRMEKRLPEMGIRKVFGASRGKLLNQVLTENFLLTVFGGILGLVFSYIIMATACEWIITLFDDWPEVPPEGASTFLTAGMLFNPVVFMITFSVCFILNFLSAIIPGFFGLKKGIIYSLSNNK